ncbi:DUF2142 domain-containing protein [Mucilaginibacter ginsenosidivorax]|uniref:DUF2142 domain-containing protein n=1 Tax=Mucilaginibacter ginsenosidivorax TaxID=862126 RepID=A0A5B8W5V4_9SPHI|nr:DUF2142 domain-containing protein [Mucilaginibacter ginsenosidivorax]QEC78292.1 DUF2142 domain-containing protein [Mucilaginibacter ginsenosidivorax]
MFTFNTFYNSLRRRLHYIYLLYAVPLVVIIAIITPAFQSPDEPNHFARAEQVSRLEFVPTFVYDKAHPITAADSISKDPAIVYPDRGGFRVDKGIYQLDHIYSPLARNSSIKVAALKTDSAKNLKWHTGIIYFNFGNTAIYPPVVYLMQALGIGVGKLLHLSIINTLYLSRILNGLLCVTLCFFALALARQSNILLLIVLLFPMTVSLFASVSQDAVLISCCFLLVGFIDDFSFGDNHRPKWKLYTMVILATVIGIAKPPYIIFAFLFLFLKLNPKQKALSIITPFTVLAFWLIINHGSFMIRFAPAEMRLNSKLQVLYILHHPLRFMGMFFDFDKTALQNVARMFVGVLAWLDMQLPDIYYRNAYICLVLGIMVSLGFKGNTRLRVALLVCAILTTIAVISAQYVTWTALESPTLGGMQGRYLIPIFPFIALSVSAYAITDRFARLKATLLSAVLLFPFYSAIIMIQVICSRYY